MKKILATIMTVVMALSLAACGGSGASQAEQSSTAAGSSAAAAESSSTAAVEARTLKLSLGVPVTSSWGYGAKRFKELVEEKSGGRYIVEIYDNDQLSSGNQQSGVEMLQQGTTDFHMHGALVWSAFAPKAVMVSMPFLFDGFEDVDNTLAGEGGDLMKQALKDAGATLLGFGENGFRQIVNTKHPIKTLDDFKGLKVRVPGSEMYISLFTELGADPTTMSASEVYTSLQQGTIDACENPLELHISQKAAEVVKYLTIWDYSYDIIYFTASNKLFDSVSAEDQKMFLDCGEQAMQEQKEYTRSNLEKYEEELRTKYGLEIYYMTDDVKAQIKEKCAAVYEAQKDIIGTDIYEVFGVDY